MDISPDQVRRAIISLIAFVLSVTVHEFGHAWMANRLGDRLPASQGRLTLSPLAHIDWLGTIAMPLLGALVPGGFPLIAWGRPVQTNPANYTTRLSRRTGHLLVSLMGPMMNLLLAVVISIVLLVAAHVATLPQALVEGVVSYFLVLNLMLMFFNLLPMPPLDGGAVLAGLLPESLQIIPRFLQRWGMLLLLALLLTPALRRVVMWPAWALAGVWVEMLQRLMGR
jgi:Zn-dependent protease